MVWLGPRNMNCHKGAAEVLEHRSGQAFSATADSNQRTPKGLARAGAFSEAQGLGQNWASQVQTGAGGTGRQPGLSNPRDMGPGPGGSTQPVPASCPGFFACGRDSGSFP